MAKASGVKKKGLSALAGATYATATIKVDRGIHKAFSGSVESFMQRRGASTIISKGRKLKQANAALFNKIERTYGVPPGVILAIWGMETGFGSFMGKQNTVSAIVTLAYDCRRPAFFEPHAIAALKLVDRGALSAKSVGAAHGEIGHTQFLPGNVLNYGVGNLNLRDKATALASTANFLRAHGWRPGVGYERQHGRHRRLEFGERLSAGDRPHGRGHRRLENSSFDTQKNPAQGRVFLLADGRDRQPCRLRAASVRRRSPLRRMKPSASFWS